MDSVVIGSNAYPSYASLSVADLYADAAVQADTWREKTDEEKARLLVTATRTLDRQVWRELYNTQALRYAQVDIINASIEMAIALADGSELQNVQNNSERIRSMTAGSVSITNYRGVDTVVTRFPQIVSELLRPYLIGDEGSMIGKVTGVDGETAFPIDVGFNSGI